MHLPLALLALLWWFLVQYEVQTTEGLSATEYGLLCTGLRTHIIQTRPSMKVLVGSVSGWLCAVSVFPDLMQPPT